MLRLRSACALMAVGALAISGCGGDDDGGGARDGGKDDPITIGVAGGFTGILESLDVPATTAAEMAVEDINASGGVLGRQLRLIKADTKSDINQGSRAGLEVINNGADAMLVSPDFNFGGGAAREAQKAGLIVVSMGAGSPKFGVQGIGPLAFTMGTSGVTDGAVAAEWAYEEEGHRTAYILLDTATDYDRDQCRGFETRWKELGGEIAGSDTFKNDDPSVSTQVTRLRSLASEPDIIALCSLPPGGAVAVKQLRDAGVESAIISNNSMDGDFWFKKSIPKLSDFYFTAPGSLWGDDESDEVNDFVSRFKERAGQPQNGFSLYGYAAVQAIANAMEAAGTTEGAKVAEAMSAFKEEPLLVPVTFSPDLHIDTAREERIVSVQDGAHELVAIRSVEKQPPLFGE